MKTNSEHRWKEGWPERGIYSAGSTQLPATILRNKFRAPGGLPNKFRAPGGLRNKFRVPGLNRAKIFALLALAFSLQPSAFPQGFMGRRMHPVAVNVLTSVADNSNAAEYKTSAVVCGSYRPILAIVTTTDTVLPDAHALTSLHGTWTQIANTNYNTIGTPLGRLSIWRLLNTNGTQSSAITNKFSNGATGGSFAILEFPGADTSGSGGSGAFINIKMGGTNTANPAITLTAAIGNHRNCVVGALASAVNPFTGTAEANWIEDIDIGHSSPNDGLYVTHHVNGTDVSIAVTMSAAEWGGIGVEVKAQP